MRSTSLKIAILFSSTAFLSITLACDDFVRLRGKLVDQDGKPIAGAKIVITLNSGTKEDISGDDGRFAYFDSISPIGSSTINLTVTKDGFETFHADYNSRELPINPNVNKEFPAERVIVLTRKLQ